MSLKLRLIVMNFLQFFIWGSWLLTIGAYWFQGRHWSGAGFGAIFSTMGIASLFMPALMGIVADRWINAEKLYGALHILGVDRRTQAARLVSLHSGPYQRLIHQPPYVEPDPATAQSDGTVSIQIRHADRAGGTGTAGFITEQKPASFRPSLQMPFATRSNPRNEMSVGQRLFWIVAIAIGAAFSAGMYLAGLESLSRLLKG